MAETISADIRHGRESAPMVAMFAKSRALERRTTNDFGYLSRNNSGQSFAGNNPIRAHIICTAAINGQVMSESPQKGNAELGPGDGIGGNGGWIVVGRAGDQTMPQKKEKKTDERTRLGRVRTEFVFFL
jgi:hypothetical protein